MKPGDVVRMRYVQVLFQGEKVRGEMGYAAPAGGCYVLVLLGFEPKDQFGSFNATEALRNTGWTRVKSKSRSAKSLKPK